MIAKLAKSTAYFFVEKQVVKKEDEDVYAYGMELLYSSILNIVLAVIIAISTNTVFPTTAFLMTFIIIRQYIGGYHAKTHLGCMSILAVVLCCFAILTRCIPDQYEIWISMLSVVSSIILILRFAPVEHPNKPLSDNEKLRLRKRGIISMFIVFVLAFVMVIFTETRRYGMYISLGQFTASTAMLCEIIKHKRMNLNHED
jgi:accessory gene regulator B